MREFEDFLRNKRTVLLHNTQRLESGLNHHRGRESALDGQRKIIAIHKRHQAMMETLFDGQVEPKTTLGTLTEALKIAEEEHQQFVYKGQSMSEGWWETLDKIQFISQLINQIEDWQYNHRSAA